MKQLTFAIFLFFTLTHLSAQEIDLDNLKNIPLQTKEDIAKFDTEAIPYIEWLENNSLKHSKRASVNALLMKWMTSTSTTTVTLHEYITYYTKKNSDFLMLFIGGWAKHVLQNPEDKSNELKGNLAGMNSILDFYEKGKLFGVKKDKKIEKLLKIRKAGDLKKFIKKKI